MQLLRARLAALRTQALHLLADAQNSPRMRGLQPRKEHELKLQPLAPPTLMASLAPVTSTSAIPTLSASDATMHTSSARANAPLRVPSPESASSASMPPRTTDAPSAARAAEPYEQQPQLTPGGTPSLPSPAHKPVRAPAPAPVLQPVPKRAPTASTSPAAHLPLPQSAAILLPQTTVPSTASSGVKAGHPRIRGDRGRTRRGGKGVVEAESEGEGKAVTDVVYGGLTAAEHERLCLASAALRSLVPADLSRVFGTPAQPHLDTTGDSTSVAPHAPSVSTPVVPLTSNPFAPLALGQRPIGGSVGAWGDVPAERMENVGTRAPCEEVRPCETGNSAAAIALPSASKPPTSAITRSASRASTPWTPFSVPYLSPEGRTGTSGDGAGIPPPVSASPSGNEPPAPHPQESSFGQIPLAGAVAARPKIDPTISISSLCGGLLSLSAGTKHTPLAAAPASPVPRLSDGTAAAADVAKASGICQDATFMLPELKAIFSPPPPLTAAERKQRDAEAERPPSADNANTDALPPEASGFDGLQSSKEMHASSPKFGVLRSLAPSTTPLLAPPSFVFAARTPPAAAPSPLPSAVPMREPTAPLAAAPTFEQPSIPVPLTAPAFGQPSTPAPLAVPAAPPAMSLGDFPFRVPFGAMPANSGSGSSAFVQMAARGSIFGAARAAALGPAVAGARTGGALGEVVWRPRGSALSARVDGDKKEEEGPASAGDDATYAPRAAPSVSASENTSRLGGSDSHTAAVSTASALFQARLLLSPPLAPREPPAQVAGQDTVTRVQPPTEQPTVPVPCVPVTAVAHTTKAVAQPGEELAQQSINSGKAEGDTSSEAATEAAVVTTLTTTVAASYAITDTASNDRLCAQATEDKANRPNDGEGRVEPDQSTEAGLAELVTEAQPRKTTPADKAEQVSPLSKQPTSATAPNAGDIRPDITISRIVDPAVDHPCEERDSPPNPAAGFTTSQFGTALPRMETATSQQIGVPSTGQVSGPVAHPDPVEGVHAREHSPTAEPNLEETIQASPAKEESIQMSSGVPDMLSSTKENCQASTAPETCVIAHAKEPTANMPCAPRSTEDDVLTSVTALREANSTPSADAHAATPPGVNPGQGTKPTGAASVAHSSTNESLTLLRTEAAVQPGELLVSAEQSLAESGEAAAAGWQRAAPIILAQQRAEELEADHSGAGTAANHDLLEAVMTPASQEATSTVGPFTASKAQPLHAIPSADSASAAALPDTATASTSAAVISPIASAPPSADSAAASAPALTSMPESAVQPPTGERAARSGEAEGNTAVPALGEAQILAPERQEPDGTLEPESIRSVSEVCRARTPLAVLRDAQSMEDQRVASDAASNSEGGDELNASESRSEPAEVAQEHHSAPAATACLLAREEVTVGGNGQAVAEAKGSPASAGVAVGGGADTAADGDTGENEGQADGSGEGAGKGNSKEENGEDEAESEEKEEVDEAEGEGEGEGEEDVEEEEEEEDDNAEEEFGAGSHSGRGDDDESSRDGGGGNEPGGTGGLHGGFTDDEDGGSVGDRGGGASAPTSEPDDDRERQSERGAGTHAHEIANSLTTQRSPAGESTPVPATVANRARVPLLTLTDAAVLASIVDAAALAITSSAAPPSASVAAQAVTFQASPPLSTATEVTPTGGAAGGNGVNTDAAMNIPEATQGCALSPFVPTEASSMAAACATHPILPAIVARAISTPETVSVASLGVDKERQVNPGYPCTREGASSMGLDGARLPSSHDAGAAGNASEGPRTEQHGANQDAGQQDEEQEESEDGIEGEGREDEQEEDEEEEEVAQVQRDDDASEEGEMTEDEAEEEEEEGAEGENGENGRDGEQKEATQEGVIHEQANLVRGEATPVSSTAAPPDPLHSSTPLRAVPPPPALATPSPISQSQPSMPGAGPVAAGSTSPDKTPQRRRSGPLYGDVYVPPALRIAATDAGRHVPTLSATSGMVTAVDPLAAHNPRSQVPCQANAQRAAVFIGAGREQGLLPTPTTSAAFAVVSPYPVPTASIRHQRSPVATNRSRTLGRGPSMTPRGLRSQGHSFGPFLSSPGD